MVSGLPRFRAWTNEQTSQETQNRGIQRVRVSQGPPRVQELRVQQSSQEASHESRAEELIAVVSGLPRFSEWTNEQTSQDTVQEPFNETSQKTSQETVQNTVQ